jgi:CRISPR-associated protein Csm1
MLILADLSGIQDYLFEVREVGGKQAQTLRFRSLYIQLITEAVGARLLRAAGLAGDRLVFCAAGKLAIDGAGLTDPPNAALDQEARQVECWLRIRTQGRLRLSIAICDSAGAMAAGFRAANRSLQAAKLRSWSNSACGSGGWQPDLMLAGVPEDPEAEADRDARLGRELTSPASRYLVFGEDSSSASFDVAGLFASMTPTAKGHPYVRELARLARHIPTDLSGQAIEFVELAGRARGAPMLGVLKADGDSLGQAIGRCLEGAGNLEPLRTLSRRLEDFFGQVLDGQMRSDPRWSNLYTVFSGGDDVFLVGPWDIAVDFASHLQRLFKRQFEQDKLTISAGVALIKPRFPIRLAARQAEDLLHRAKTEEAPRTDAPKDQCSALGQIWKWRDHEAIVGAGRQLADWVDGGAIRRGWLHTLLELALLRRGAQPGRDPGMPPVMATSRLAYHVGRNWPRPDDRDPSKGAARRWIDGIATEFDRFQATSDVDTIYLPTIVRYAMLATRGADKEEIR